MQQKVLVIEAGSCEASEKRIAMRMQELGEGWKISQIAFAIDHDTGAGVHMLLVEKQS